MQHRSRFLVLVKILRLTIIPSTSKLHKTKQYCKVPEFQKPFYMVIIYPMFSYKSQFKINLNDGNNPCHSTVFSFVLDCFLAKTVS